MPRGRVKSSQLVVGALPPARQDVSTTIISDQAVQDRLAIIRTLEEYTQAWFSGDAAAMERCLHPELTARLLQLEPEERSARGIQVLTRSQGIQATLGACTHPMERRGEITILDLSGHSASARAILGDWAAYVHLSFTGLRWAIVNILWEWMSAKDRRSA